MARKIDHIGIAVKSIEESLPDYRGILGVEEILTEEVPEQKMRVAMIAVGDSRIELLEGLDPESAVSRFISRRGEGLHHVSLEVDDIRGELRRLKQAGIRLVDEIPRRGAGGRLVAFIHPSSASGVLIELSQADIKPHQY